MLGAIDEDEEEEFSDPVSKECSDLAASSGPKSQPAATSHTILVVDNSGSMKLRDVANGSSELLQRCKALVSSLSKDLFAEQALLSAGACTDLVSCVRMEDGQTRLLCELLPLNQARVSLLARNAPGSSLLCAPRGEGFYAPALAEAVRLAELGASVLDPTACTTVLFFSDGRPSDKPCDIPGAGAWVCARCTWRNAADELQCVSCASSRLDEYGGDHERWQRTRLLPHLAAQLEELCALLDYDKRRLQWHSIGLGKEEEFVVLRSMTEALPRDIGHFNCCTLDARSLARGVSSVSSSLTQSRLASSTTKYRRPLRAVFLNQFEGRFTRYPRAKIYKAPPPGEFGAPNELLGEADIEIADGAFGHGGERNVFAMRFVTRTTFTKVTADSRGRQQRKVEFEAKPGEQWVVKEDKHARVNDSFEIETHDKSLVCQVTAGNLAQNFNAATAQLGGDIPRLKYLEAFLITTEIPSKRILFTERRLEAGFQKWNTNNGIVLRAERPLGSGDGSSDEGRIRTEHVPQAFSHWTLADNENGVDYEDSDGRARRGRLLVCDIQGCYAATRRELVLNDPVIHSQSGEIEANMFGLTDHGSRGIMLFMKSHVCNPLCAALGLPPNTLFEEEKTAAFARSSRETSELTVLASEHCAKRGRERGIPKRQMQAAKKHGEKVVQADGRLKAKLPDYAGQGPVAYVSDASERVGVTAFRPGVPDLSSSSSGGDGGSAPFSSPPPPGPPVAAAVEPRRAFSPVQGSIPSRLDALEEHAFDSGGGDRRVEARGIASRLAALEAALSPGGDSEGGGGGVLPQVERLERLAVAGCHAPQEMMSPQLLRDAAILGIGAPAGAEGGAEPIEATAPLDDAADSAGPSSRRMEADALSGADVAVSARGEQAEQAGGGEWLVERGKTRPSKPSPAASPAPRFTIKRHEGGRSRLSVMTAALFEEEDASEEEEVEEGPVVGGGQGGASSSDAAGPSTAADKKERRVRKKEQRRKKEAEEAAVLAEHFQKAEDEAKSKLEAVAGAVGSVAGAVGSVAGAALMGTALGTAAFGIGAHSLASGVLAAPGAGARLFGAQLRRREAENERKKELEERRAKRERKKLLEKKRIERAGDRREEIR